MSLKTETTLVEKIDELKKVRDAVIVAHNYQAGEIQDIADFVGDSLAMARYGAQTIASTILVCGVHFMAESAALLSPNKKILVPDLEAGCSLAECITKDQLVEWKKEFTNAVVVAYVNTSAAVKAESDICCTSSNALKVVESVPEKDILFIPDQCLAHWVSTKTKKNIIAYPGYCITHKRLTAELVRKAKEKHPEAIVIAHPECQAE